MKIVAFLNHPTIQEYSFSEENAKHLVERLPHCSLMVCGDEVSFVQELADAEVVLVSEFKQEWVAAAPKLRIISTPAAGRDYFKVDLPDGVNGVQPDDFGTDVWAIVIREYALATAESKSAWQLLQKAWGHSCPIR